MNDDDSDSESESSSFSSSSSYSSSTSEETTDDSVLNDRDHQPRIPYPEHWKAFGLVNENSSSDTDFAAIIARIQGLDASDSQLMKNDGNGIDMHDIKGRINISYAKEHFLLCIITREVNGSEHVLCLYNIERDEWLNITYREIFQFGVQIQSQLHSPMIQPLNKRSFVYFYTFFNNKNHNNRIIYYEFE